MKKSILISLVALLVIISGLLFWKIYRQPVPDETNADTVSTVPEKAKGFITKAYTCGKNTCIDVDYINWFSGTAARSYCTQKGDENCGLDGYAIQNDNPKIRTFQLSSDPSITYVARPEDGGGFTDASITPQQFLDIFNGVTPPPPSVYSLGSGNDLFQIQVSNGKISSLAEQYLP